MNTQHEHDPRLWLVVVKGVTLGPYTWNEVVDTAQYNDRGDQLVWRPGFHNWTRFDDVPTALTTSKRVRPPPVPAAARLDSNFSNNTVSTPSDCAHFHSNTNARRVTGDVKGWLLALVLWFTVLRPLGAVWDLYSTWLSDYDTLWRQCHANPGLHSILLIETLLDAISALACLVAGIQLWRRKPHAHLHAQLALASNAAYLLLGALIPRLAGTSPHVVDTLWQAQSTTLLLGMCIVAFWFLYLMMSQRVLLTYKLDAKNVRQHWILPQRLAFYLTPSTWFETPTAIAIIMLAIMQVNIVTRRINAGHTSSVSSDRVSEPKSTSNAAIRDMYITRLALAYVTHNRNQFDSIIDEVTRHNADLMSIGQSNMIITITKSDLHAAVLAVGGKQD